MTHIHTVPLHPDILQAYAVLETGEPVGRELAVALGELHGPDVLDLASLAHKVKIRHGGSSGSIHACSIMNAKSGVCSENCRFCAQSSHHSAVIDVYGLADVDAVLFQARQTASEGISYFGIVTSGFGYRTMTKEFQQILEMIDRLHQELPDLHICASLGVLGEEPALELARHGIAHYNINIQVAPHRYGELIADTHTVHDRIDTIKRLRRHHISVCCGGIIGVGEQMKDRIEMLFALADLDVSVIPLNVLVPIDGTPLEGSDGIPLDDIVKTFALCRLVHPRKIIKIAAGRETVMKDFQGLLMLSGADGLLTGGYLTTRGRATEDDRMFMRQLQWFN
ncbi:MAG: biotin synthase BioB [Chlorobiaceae bacterium]|jgi:biotin synthase|nr:biotin synthase BioB [Chlorobiaceae bacterium]